MKRAEMVTFGGSGLERHAEWRGDAAKMSQLASAAEAKHIPFWRGKPLVGGDGRDHLAGVSHDAAVLTHGAEAPIFLGMDGTAPVFAHDVSRWEPEGQETASVGQFLDPTEQIYPGLEARFCELRAVMTHLNARDAELAATGKAMLGWHQTHGFCAKCGAQSVISQAGWQRDCPACGAHHFPRTDPVVIMLILHGNSVLVGRSPGWPEGMYSLLAGFVEPGETIEAAVRREVFEEAGVRVGQVDYLSSQPWPFPSSLMFGCMGQATTRKITVDPVELDDAIWLTREEMLEVFAGQNPNIRAAREGAIARFLIENWLADTLD